MRHLPLIDEVTHGKVEDFLEITKKGGNPPTLGKAISIESVRAEFIGRDKELPLPLRTPRSLILSLIEEPAKALAAQIKLLHIHDNTNEIAVHATSIFLEIADAILLPKKIPNLGSKSKSKSSEDPLRGIKAAHKNVEKIFKRICDFKSGTTIRQYFFQDLSKVEFLLRDSIELSHKINPEIDFQLDLGRSAYFIFKYYCQNKTSAILKDFIQKLNSQKINLNTQHLSIIKRIDKLGHSSKMIKKLMTKIEEEDADERLYRFFSGSL